MSIDLDARPAGDAPDDAPRVGMSGTRRSLGGRLYHGETSVDFYGRRWWGLIFSGVLLLITLVSLFVSGLNLGLDFEGGVAWEVPAANVSIDDARSLLADHGINGDDAKIQQRTQSDGSKNLFVQVGDQPLAKQEEVRQAFAAKAQVDVSEVSSSSVSSTWGRAITEKAVRALVIFLVLVALFIAWRFEWRMALGAIAAMVHDVLISVGVYSVFGFEVTPATVVAFLTILGFSLYDTIVVFDKVKDNTERFMSNRVPYGDITNVSMNQVLMRSLNTSLAAVLPVLSLLILGSEILGAVALREFSLALLVGLLTGSYSSIFIAAPLLAIMKEREPKYRSMRDQHATGPELERLVLGGAPTSRHAVRQRARRPAGAPIVSGAEFSEAPPAGAISDAPKAVLTHPPRPRKKKRRDA